MTDIYHTLRLAVTQETKKVSFFAKSDIKVSFQDFYEQVKPMKRPIYEVLF